MKKYLTTSLIIFSLILVSKPTNIFSQNDNLSESQQYRLEQIEKKQATQTSTAATSSAKTKNQTITFVEGQITATGVTSLYVDTKHGTKVIYTSDTTKFLNLDSIGKKLIGVSDLKVNDKIYIIGLSKLAVSGSAKIIIRDQTKPIRNFSFLGRISEITDKNLKLANFTRDDLPSINLLLTSETKVTNSRQEILKLINLKVSDKILASGFFDDKNNLVTAAIFKISSDNGQTATVSAK